MGCRFFLIFTGLVVRSLLFSKHKFVTSLEVVIKLYPLLRRKFINKSSNSEIFLLGFF